MKVSEAFSADSVLENRLILLDRRNVLKRLEKPSLLGLMERNLETTDLQVRLGAPRSAPLKGRETRSEMAQVSFQGGSRFSVPFHHTSGVNKAQNSLWNLLMQGDSSTRGVF